MDNEKLVQLVTAEVLRQLGQVPLAIQDKAIQPPQKALAIFTGGTIGLEQSLGELLKLQALNIELTVVLSAAAKEIVGIKRIKDCLGSDTSVITTQSSYPGKLLREADIVLVPVLTQNTAAKLAYTLSDTLATTLIMQALMLGKPVLAAINAADPQDSWRVKGNMGKCPPGLLQALRENLRKVEGYGIRLVQVEDLAAGSQKVMDCRVKTSLSIPQAKKSVLDAAAIKVAAGNGLKSITVAQGTIITPLARDVARDYGLEIVQAVLINIYSRSNRL